MAKKPWLATISALSLVGAIAAILPVTWSSYRLNNETVIFLRFLQSAYPFYLPCEKGSTARAALNRLGVIEIGAIYKHVGRQKVAWDWNTPVTASTTFTVKQK